MKKSFLLASSVLLILCSVSQSAAAPVYLTKPFDRAKYLIRSGVAYDAFESVFGLISIIDPRSFFTPNTSQVTWWGEFKSFSTWDVPHLKARWYNPDGVMVSQQSFTGEECRLAKVTLEVREQNIELKEGRWTVEVAHDGKVIDRKNFVVFNPNRPPVSPQSASDVLIRSSDSQGDYGGG